MCHFRETMLFVGICNFDLLKILSMLLSPSPFSFFNTKNKDYIQILKISEFLICLPCAV